MLRDHHGRSGRIGLLKNPTLSKEPYKHITFNTSDSFDFRTSYYKSKGKLRNKANDQAEVKNATVEEKEKEEKISSKNALSVNEQQQRRQKEPIPDGNTLQLKAVEDGVSNIDLSQKSKAGDNKASITPANMKNRPKNWTNKVLIHVCDDVRKVTKNFHCDKAALLSEMKYFQTFFKKSSDRVDISVHCDIHIFEWLMRYIEHIKNKNTPRPSFSIRAIISILISSEFLGMDNLVEKAVKYIRENINDVIALPVSLSCLNEKVLTKLSLQFTSDELASVVDPKNKILDKLFRKKLEELLSVSNLRQCTECSCLFLSEHQEMLQCPNARPIVNFYGELSTSHSKKNDFDFVEDCILHWRRKDKLGWKTIYWRVWGLCQIFKCLSCKQYFQLSQIKTCATHAGSRNENGNYSCCSQSVEEFSIYKKGPSGCVLLSHIPNLKLVSQSSENDFNRTEKIWDTFKAHESEITFKPQVEKLPEPIEDPEKQDLAPKPVKAKSKKKGISGYNNKGKNNKSKKSSAGLRRITPSPPIVSSSSNTNNYLLPRSTFPVKNSMNDSNISDDDDDEDILEFEYCSVITSDNDEEMCEPSSNITVKTNKYSVRHRMDNIKPKETKKPFNRDDKWGTDNQRDEDFRRIRRYSNHLLKQRATTK